MSDHDHDYEYLHRNSVTGIERTTGVTVSASGDTLFEHEFLFVHDAEAQMGAGEPQHQVRFQDLDAVYSRGANQGRGVVGEGGSVGPGVVGIAGAALPRTDPAFPRSLRDGPHPGRGIRAGVIGFGSAQQRLEFVDLVGVGNAIGVLGESDTAPGVQGRSLSGPGVQGDSDANDGVLGQSHAPARSGVHGFNSTEREFACGVSGRCHSAEGFGVHGANDNGDGVFGLSVKGLGVRGNSKNDDGIAGFTEAVNKSGLRGVNASPSPDPSVPLQKRSAAYGVTGQADGSHGTGVRGLSDKGNGLRGDGGRYGAILIGDVAPLYLSPSADVGPPSTSGHRSGELYVDKNGELFFFKGDTWYRVQLSPA